MRRSDVSAGVIGDAYENCAVRVRRHVDYDGKARSRHGEDGLRYVFVEFVKSEKRWNGI